MKSKTWLILPILIIALLLAFSGKAASAYFSDGENSVDNVLRINIIEVSFLGSADNFAVLVGTTVTNSGATIVNGDLGVSPGTSIVGFPPGTVNGTQHTADAAALQAQNDVTTAYNYLAVQPPDSDLTGQALGGLTLTPGVYFYTAAAQLTGTLTLDATGNSSGLFIFQIGSTLDTAASSQIILNGAKAANVYWVVGTAVTLGAGSDFKGNILALAAITLNSGAVVEGRTLGKAAIVLDTNNVTKPAP